MTSIPLLELGAADVGAGACNSAVLRPVRSKDAPVIQRRFPQWEVVRWLNANIPWPYPADGAATYIAACLEEMARGEKSHWAIVPRKGPADLIGIIDLWPDDGVSRDQRGFWLDPAFQGQGLMTEAIASVNDFAFRTLGIESFYVCNAASNEASRRVKQKTGAEFVALTGRIQGIEHFTQGVADEILRNLRPVFSPIGFHHTGIRRVDIDQET